MTDPSKRRHQVTLPRPQLTATPYEFGEYIARDVWMVRDLGCGDFV